MNRLAPLALVALSCATPYREWRQLHVLLLRADQTEQIDFEPRSADLLTTADVDGDGRDELLVTATDTILVVGPDDEHELLDLSPVPPGFGVPVSAHWVPVGESAHLFIHGLDAGRWLHAMCKVKSEPSCSGARTIGVDPDGSRLAAGDLDEDGRLDLVTSVRRNLKLYLGAGDDPSALEWSEWKWIDEDHSSLDAPERGIAIGDVDDDGHLDVVATRAISGVITVLYGDGEGGFTGAGESTFEGGHQFVEADQVVLAQLGTHPGLDIFVVGTTAHQFVNLGDRAFEQVDPVANLIEGRTVLVGELDEAPGVELLLLDHDGTAQIGGADAAGKSWSFDPLALPDDWLDASWEHIATADFDGDGIDDLVLDATHHEGELREYY